MFTVMFVYLVFSQAETVLWGFEGKKKKTSPRVGSVFRMGSRQRDKWTRDDFLWLRWTVSDAASSASPQESEEEILFQFLTKTNPPSPPWLPVMLSSDDRQSVIMGFFFYISYFFPLDWVPLFRSHSSLRGLVQPSSISNIVPLPLPRICARFGSGLHRITWCSHLPHWQDTSWYIILMF